MSYDLKNKVVLITGAANGIGNCFVRYVLDEGAKHVSILDIAPNGPAFEEELNKKYGAGKAKFYKCDVTDEKTLIDTFDAVKNENGYVDCVVNNAGIMNDSKRFYRKMIEINVLALITSTLKALELMRQDEGGKGGTIINIASVAALIQKPTVPIYFTTKSAVLQFSNCIGLDAYYSRTNVRVITMCFGCTDSALLSPEKIGHFDKVLEGKIMGDLKSFPFQSIESAARGMIEAYKKGSSGSTWLVENDKPARDISENIRRGYEAFQEKIFSHLPENK